MVKKRLQGFGLSVEIGGLYILNGRIKKLRQISFDGQPSISIERPVSQGGFHLSGIDLHSVEDLKALNDREMTGYAVAEKDIRQYEQEPLRQRLFNKTPFFAGCFTNRPGDCQVNTVDSNLFQA